MRTSLMSRLRKEKKLGTSRERRTPISSGLTRKRKIDTKNCMRHSRTRLMGRST